MIDEDAMARCVDTYGTLLASTWEPSCSMRSPLITSRIGRTSTLCTAAVGGESGGF